MDREQKSFLEKELRNNKGFIEALDEEGRYFVLASNKFTKDYYLDDFVSDDQFEAIMVHIKSYLKDNIKGLTKELGRMSGEEKNDLQG